MEKMGSSPFLKEIDAGVLNWVDKDSGSEEDKAESKAEVDAHMAAMREMLGLN